MAIFVMSDIHGKYDMFLELLEKIDLKDDDLLYILGDVLDRGSHPIKALRKIMEMPNVICLVGNHEIMALECLEFLMQKITDVSIKKLNVKMLDNLVTWQYNGSRTTIAEFKELDSEEQQEVIDFIKEFSLYEEVTVGDRKYILVHAGLGDFYPGKRLEEYSIHELVWTRTDYERPYYEDTYVITGHTPTQTIEGNPNPGYIYMHNHHIAIDCGACFPGGKACGAVPGYRRGILCDRGAGWVISCPI